MTGIFALNACSTVPPLEPIERKQKVVAPAQPRVIQLTVSEALDRYAPPGFALDPDTDIDLDTVIEFDTTKPWGQALTDGLQKAGIEIAKVTTPQKKAVNPAPALSRAPAQHVPAPHQVTPTRPTSNPVERSSAQIPGSGPSNVVPQQAVTELTTNEQVWEVQANESLKKTLTAWCKRAGCQLLWNVKDEQTSEEKDLIIGGGMRSTGSFRDAVKELFGSLHRSARVEAEYRPDNFPPLLLVTRQGVVE